ncbi:MAG: c-type cytochrome [Devosia sp.]
MRLLPALAALALLSAPVAAQDIAAGANVFRKCQACHMVGDDAVNRVGPVLTGVVGRPAASLPDYNYSAALTELAAAGLVWTPEELAKFLQKPRAFVPGTKMAFAGLLNASDIANLIAYLESVPAVQ